MALVHAPDLNLYPQPDGSAQADTGLLRATLAGDLAAPELLRVEVAQKVLTYAAGVFAWVDRHGNHQPIAAISSAPLQVEGSVGRFAPPDAPYIVEYQIEGRRVKRRVILTAPLPEPDPAVFPDPGDVWLTIFGPLRIEPPLTLAVQGQPVTDGMWTADAIDLVDADGNVVERLDRIWSRATGDESLVCAGQYRLVQDPITGGWQVYECLPYWWLKTLAAENYPVVIDPTVVATSTSSLATGEINRRRIDLSPDGTMWLLLNNGSDVGKLYYSKDGGQTWTDSGISISGFKDGGLFITPDDVLQVAYTEAGAGIQYVSGTRNGNSWSLAAKTAVDSGVYPDLVAHKDGQDYICHIVYMFNTVTYSQLKYARVRRRSNGSATVEVASYILASQDISDDSDFYANIDLGHTGDGKTPSGSPVPLFLTYSFENSANATVMFRRGAYASGGNTTWYNPVVLDTTTYAYKDRMVSCFDGTRVIIAWVPHNATNTVKVVERDAADTTTTPRNPPSPNDGEVIGLGITYDRDQNIYLLAVGYTSKDLKMCKFTRATGTWGSWTTIYAGDVKADSLTVKRGWYGSAIDIAWSNGTASPYSVMHHRITLNAPPYEPKITVSPAAFAASSGCDITIQHNDPDSDQMSAYALKRVYGTTTEWWDATSKSWVSSEKWNSATGTSVTIPAADNAGKWSSGVSYQLYAATKDAQGVAGPYNSTGVTANAGAKPVAQITAPGATVAQQQVTVQWATDQPQGAYQLRLKAADGTVLEDTGKVLSKDARARTLSYVLANNTQYTVELTVWDQMAGGGVASNPVVVTFTTSFTTPLPPQNVMAIPDPAAGKIDLQWRRGADYQNSEFGGSWRVERLPAGASQWTPIAVVSDPPSGTMVTYSDYAAASGVAYEYRVVALGNNTTEMPGTPVAAQLDLEGVWLHDPRDPANTVHQFQYRDPADESEFRPVSATFQFAGRSRPVARFGEQSEQKLRVRLALPSDTQDELALRALVDRRTTLCYRDDRGRKLYCVIPASQIRTERWGGWADLELVEVDYQEAVQ